MFFCKKHTVWYRIWKAYKKMMYGTTHYIYISYHIIYFSWDSTFGIRTLKMLQYIIYRILQLQPFESESHESWVFAHGTRDLQHSDSYHSCSSGRDLATWTPVLQNRFWLWAEAMSDGEDTQGAGGSNVGCRLCDQAWGATDKASLAWQKTIGFLGRWQWPRVSEIVVGGGKLTVQHNECVQPAA